MRRSTLPLILVPALFVAACSSDDGAAPTTSPASTAPAATTTEATTTTEAPATTTTISLEELAATYSGPGPFPVGVTTLTLAKGPKVEVWYPAVPGSDGSETYDVRDFVPEGVKALLTANVPATVTYPATRDAEPANGSFPVVLFSHGFTGFRLQSTLLTSHLASWGLIVAAPDHPSRDLSNVLSGTASGDLADSVDDLMATLDLVVAEGSRAGGPFEGHVDADHVVAVGHSAGGGTVLGAAATGRLVGYVSMASGARNVTDLPDVPSFFIAGSVDGIVPADAATRPAFEAAPAPSLLWVIDGAGHLAFSDLCTFGNGLGIIGVAEANGLGQFLDAQPQLRSLGEDGCVAPAIPVTTTFPIIHHAVTAWVRVAVGLDPEPVGLGPEVAGAYATPVVVEQK